MIHKVVGYQGFQSYGDLPYASLKPGKFTLDSNTVWEKTQRDQDKQEFYHNSNYQQTIRQNKMDSVVQPNNYRNVPIVQKGTNGSTSVPGRPGFFSQTATSSLSNKEQEQFNTNKDQQFLSTGVEHWQTNYKGSLNDKLQQNKSQRPEWTFHKPPHQVYTQVGPTEYKKQYGKLGENPRDVIPLLSQTNPRSFDELKLGTSQLSQHLPGYQGFIPSIITASNATEHGQGTEPRTDFMKTNLKENYHIKMPGYAGHIPQSVVNQRQIPQESLFNKNN